MKAKKVIIEHHVNQSKPGENQGHDNEQELHYQHYQNHRDILVNR